MFFLFLLPVCTYAGIPDFTEVEIIAILKKENPKATSVNVKYNEKTDAWVFKLHFKDTNFPGSGEGYINDNRENPKIEYWPEG